MGWYTEEFEDQQERMECELYWSAAEQAAVKGQKKMSEEKQTKGRGLLPLSMNAIDIRLNEVKAVFAEHVDFSNDATCEDLEDLDECVCEHLYATYPMLESASITVGAFRRIQVAMGETVKGRRRSFVFDYMDEKKNDQEVEQWAYVIAITNAYNHETIFKGIDGGNINMAVLDELMVEVQNSTLKWEEWLDGKIWSLKTAREILANVEVLKVIGGSNLCPVRLVLEGGKQ